MNGLSLIDLHCDTLYELFKHEKNLDQNDCKISLENLTPYDHYAQFFASWCSYKYDDDQGYSIFLQMDDYLSAQLSNPAIAAHICRVRTADELQTAWNQKKHAAILAIEDARILGGDLTRMDELARRGVRYMTLLWNGDTCIGGAFNTDNGLTPFGKDAVKRAFELGIVPDLSHCSEQSAEDALELAALAGRPVIASHSDSFTVHAHRRNLRDRHFEAIRDGGGLVGLNLYCAHLRDENEGKATVDDVVRHAEHYLSLGGENTVAMGGDWDGAELPEGFSTIADAEMIANAMARLGYSDTLIGKIFYQNALDFIKRSF